MNSQGAERRERANEQDRSDDNRKWAQRDRDRILYTTALRRLDGITQVASAGETHVFHNRLTHTFEVAQIARRLAEHLIASQPAAAEALDLNADVAEAAGLAHDLGHPPFGHIGEEQLDKCVVDAGNPDGFEGNAQSFRILTKLAVRHSSFRGLNLSRATLNAVLKYPWPRATGGKRHRKYGAYRSEESEFQWVRRSSPENQRSVEAEIMDWADDIAYSVHDLFDFFRAGLIPAERLRDEAEFNELAMAIRQYWQRKLGSHVWDMEQLDKVRSGILTVFPLDRPFAGTRIDRAKLRSYTSWLIGRYVRGEPGQPLPIQLEPDARNEPLVAITQGARSEVDFLKELTAHYVIRHVGLATLQHGQRKVIKEVFESLFNDLRSDSPTLLPVWAAELLEEELHGRYEESAKNEVRTRVVADVICGMTEAQTLALHGRLMGHQSGSLLDRIP